MYKNNSGFSAKTKVNKYKKGLCLTEKLELKNPLLFLYYTDDVEYACGVLFSALLRRQCIKKRGDIIAALCQIA